MGGEVAKRNPVEAGGLKSNQRSSSHLEGALHGKEGAKESAVRIEHRMGYE
jgi:hypothetical protein